MSHLKDKDTVKKKKSQALFHLQNIQFDVYNTKFVSRQRLRHFREFSSKFLVGTSQQHKEILIQMGLENLCVEPYFSNLRNNMAALVEVLAAVAAGLPQHQYGFYRLGTYFVLTKN